MKQYFIFTACPKKCPSCGEYTVVNDEMGCYCVSCDWEYGW